MSETKSLQEHFGHCYKCNNAFKIETDTLYTKDECPVCGQKLTIKRIGDTKAMLFIGKGKAIWLKRLSL